jgi:hypothetical protein
MYAIPLAGRKRIALMWIELKVEVDNITAKISGEASFLVLRTRNETSGLTFPAYGTGLVASPV